MQYNYHTHTKRCNHANGEDREYVEEAIARGLQVLGFADHAPYPFPNGFCSAHRMRIDQMQNYVDSVRALQKEYEKDIRILLGFELEYYPAYHAEAMRLLRAVEPDYMIMGQHFFGNELDAPYAPYLTDENMFSAYISQILEGLQTGDFVYLAHPDLAGYHYPEEVVKREYRRLCEGAKALNIPLEINFLGLRTNRHYPDKRFFEIAAKVGNTVVLGADAHNPCDVTDPTAERIAKQWCSELGLKLLEKPFI